LLDKLPLIDRHSYRPAYAQLAQILRQAVAAGYFHPGDKLPSESELVRHFEVSSMTVRRVINILADQGLVSTSQGKGTFVRQIELGEATFNLQVLRDLFIHPETAVRILDAKVVRANARVARKLSIKENLRTVYIRRLITRGGEALLYHREYLLCDPSRPLIEVELEVTSIKGLFDGSSGTGLKRGNLKIEAVNLDKEEAGYLQGQIGDAAFCLEHIFYDFDDRPISWGRFICRGDRLHFTATLGVQESAGG
jgi:GntR family transcriptional regulator